VAQGGAGGQCGRAPPGEPGGRRGADGRIDGDGHHRHRGPGPPPGNRLRPAGAKGGRPSPGQPGGGAPVGTVVRRLLRPGAIPVGVTPPMSAKPSLEPPHTPLWRVGLLAPALAFLGQFLPLVLFFVPVPIAVVTDLRGWRAGVGWGAAAVAAAVAGVWVLGMDVSRHGAVLASVTLLALLPVAMGLVGGLLYRSDRHQGVTLLAPGGLVIAMVLTAWLSGRWLF